MLGRRVKGNTCRFLLTLVLGIVCRAEVHGQTSNWPVSLWILGYAYPQALDGPDANLYSVNLQTRLEGALVEVHGNILRAPELTAFLDQLEQLNRRLTGSARLERLEPNLKLNVETASKTGLLNVVVGVTPDQLSQSHKFIFSIHQPALQPCISDCRTILARYPARPKT